jgi:hypothetical protein
MHRQHFGVGLVYLLLGAVSIVHAQGKPSGSDEVVVIDGAKNPEQIPNWDAWLEAFRTMAGPAEPEVPIPSVIFIVTTQQQRELIRREAQKVMAEEQRVFGEALKLQDGLTAENRGERQNRVEALEMQRRRAALDARDRLLAQLPQAQFAFREYIDHVRRSIKVTIMKSQIPQFVLPE